jgi:hypothetical protein
MECHLAATRLGQLKQIRTVFDVLILGLALGLELAMRSGWWIGGAVIMLVALRYTVFADLARRGV